MQKPNFCGRLDVAVVTSPSQKWLFFALPFSVARDFLLLVHP